MDWDDKLDVTWGPLGRFNVYLKNGKIETTRKTDSLLDMLGSIGGVYEAQTILGQLIVGSYNTYALQSFLALNLVRFVSSTSTDPVQDNNQKREQRK